MVDFMRDGKRIRKGYTDLEAAKRYCREKKLEIVNKGIESLNLSDRVRAEATEAMRRLKGTGASILDAIDEYLRRHPATAGETVSQTCQKYLAAMREQGRRPLSIIEKEVKYRALCETMGETPTSAVDVSDIEEWATSRNVGTITTDAYIGAGKTLLQFFRRGGRLQTRRHTDEKPPVTWDVATVQKIMDVAEKIAPDTVAALAVLFFAGLRPHEMLRLKWDAIDLDAGIIRLTGEDTKTRSMRNVEIAANLRKWLTEYRGIGTVAPSVFRYRDQRVAVMKACKLTKWPVDVARHTFATMHYNAHQNAAATMAQLGHFGNPQMFLRHYKGVPVTATDAAAFWQITPKEGAANQKDTKKVLLFAAAS
jgi:integrase